MQRTTGETISRLGMLTVLAYNQTEPRLDAQVRRQAKREIASIMNGLAGVEPGKVRVRTMERCYNGGALVQVNGVGIWGAN